MNVKEQWAYLKQEHPNMPTWNAAKLLGISEVELLATKCGCGARRLEANWGELIQELPKLGKVKALTRNLKLSTRKLASTKMFQFLAIWDWYSAATSIYAYF